jgi:hypothetical protein
MSEWIGDECDPQAISVDTLTSFSPHAALMASSPRISQPPRLGSLPKGHINSHKLAIQNVRIELKKLFPSVKFSVRSERNSIDITYPKNADLDLDQLKKLSNRYKDGYFDGMEDIVRREAA